MTIGFTWKAQVKVSRVFTFEFTGRIDGDSISGTVKLGPFGNAIFKGARA